MQHQPVCPTAALQRQSGFTLIEILVASLILAIGLVGVAGLQALSLKNNQSAFMRSQATALAYDLADRMRANKQAAEAGAYDPANAAFTTGCRTNTGCVPNTMAQHDLSEWNSLIAEYLPSGQGFVCIDSTPNDGADAGSPDCDGNGSQFAIKLWWDDNRDGAISVAAADNERQVITFRL